MSVLRAAVCGGGMRSRSVWQRHLAELDGVELVGVMDPSEESLAKVVAEGHVGADAVWTELESMLETTRPDVLLVCPIHEAHAASAAAGLSAGCHVLVEKPFATRLDDAIALTRQAEAAGLTLGVVQNWRTKSAGRALRRAIGEGVIGEVSHVFFRYLRDREKPHLPDYLFDEADPLLYAMTIHHIDLFRYALGQEIVRVSGHAHKPSWSRYREPSVVSLWMETDGGVAIAYTATFSSRAAHVPLESLQIEGELGTLINDSDYFEPPLLLSRRDDQAAIDLTADVTARDPQSQYDLADREVLTNFRAAIVDGAPLISPARENLGTLAALEACRLALRDATTVEVPALA